MDTRCSFTLADGWHLVDGVEKCALYDLRTGRVYSINHSGKGTLQRVVDPWDRNSLGGPDAAFLDQLAELGVYDSSTKVASQRRSSAVEKRRIDPFPFLDFLWLELTEQCNLRCLHCYASAGVQRSTLPHLSRNDWMKVLSEAAEQGCDSVQFTGGEPLLCNDLIALLRYARDCGYGYVEVFTNATLLTEELVAALRDSGACVATSLYGAQAAAHDRVTQVSGSFARTLQALGRLKDCGVPVRVAAVAMLQNQDEVTGVQSLVESLGLTYSGMDVVRPAGRGESQCSPPAIPSLLKSRTMERPVFWTDEGSFYRNQVFNPCWAGQLTVDCHGDVTPCIMARREVAGNVLRSHLRDIIEAEPLRSWWRLTKDDIDICRVCEFRYACGDCRVLALGDGQSLSARYPRCTYDPYRGVWGESDTAPQPSSTGPGELPEVTCVTPDVTETLAQCAVDTVDGVRSNSARRQTACMPKCFPCLPSCTPNCMPSCFPCLPKCTPKCLPNCLPCLPKQPKCMPKCMPSCFPCLPNCMPRCMP